ncbi:MAG: sugar ABC transporter ATP-binding protein [Tissierellia bacterium]|nr:sugar ABC transporter ATP-binding protein [Tissierellia bacterium]
MDIKMKNICKSFGKNNVLRGVDFNLREGEIHALVGENGAGKSTLMNILAGILEKDNGEIYIDGQKIEYTDSNEVRDKYRIEFIHQELVDWSELTVMENIFMNREIKKGPFLDKDAMYDRCKKLFKTLEIDIDPNQRVGNLSVGMRQMMEIAKANLNKVNVLILDEPTSALTNNEIDKLFKLMKKLRDEKVSMIYISHRMEEIFALTNKITVMRDGVSVKELNTSDTDEKEIVKLMVGREIGDFYPEMTRNIGEKKLEVKNFNREGYFKDVNFYTKKGEILGFAGLMGAGRSEIMRSLFGIDPKDSGNILLDGKEITINNPLDAKKHKIAFITENRQEEGLILDESIRENISILNLNEISKNGFIDEDKENKLSNGLLKKLTIKATSIEDKTMDLSGGNQQKVVMAKWFGLNPEVLILDEPTKGVDVGAKREIYLLIDQMTKIGVSVIMISSDLPELLSLSDRIYVVYEGKIQGELDRSKADSQSVMYLATGGVNE